MTRADALSRLLGVFQSSGLEEAGREARLTLCAACGFSAASLIARPDEPLGAAAARLSAFARRRAKGEPLSRILGRREFWGLELHLSPDVLDPRPDTETIVETAVALFADRRVAPLRALDLGVGSGAILCALLTEFPNALGIGVDVSPSAAAVARANAAASGFASRADIRVGRWTEGLTGPFDLIVSNPPYIRSADLERLPEEVRAFDPRLALDGGTDGLDAYRAIIPAAAGLLAPGGRLLLEVGAGQASEALALVSKAGFLLSATRRDLAGIERVVIAGERQAGRDREGVKHGSNDANG